MNLLKCINKSTKIVVFLSVLNILSSCTDLLEPKPITQLSDLSAFDTPDRILAQVNGLYSTLKSGQFLGGRMQVYMDVRGEDFQNLTANGVTGLFAWNHTQAPSNAEVINAWSAGYSTINRVNVFLKGMDDNASKISVALANQYRAEARLIRAVSYFYLSQLYCRPYSINNGNTPGLPLRLVANTSAVGAGLARSSVADVYNQILADLNFAESNLPLSYATPLLNTTRAHRNTSIALKVRVNLVMGNYANVLTEAQKIIAQTVAPFSSTSGVAHALAPNILSIFSAPYTLSESIFSMPMTAADVPGTQNALAGYYLPGTISGGAGEFAFDPTGIIANSAFATTDTRYSSLTTLASTSRWCFKFRNTPPPVDFVPVIRYSEILLSHAEALARQNTAAVDVNALALLNAVRQRSSASVYTSLGLGTSAALVNAILLERRIEFFGEGLRSIDITRQALPFPAKTGVAGTVPTTSQNYIWPIPQNELDNNPLMTQN